MNIRYAIVLSFAAAAVTLLIQAPERVSLRMDQWTCTATDRFTDTCIEYRKEGPEKSSTKRADS